MKDRDFYLRIAEMAFPGLKDGRFFAEYMGTACYFSGLLGTEVIHSYRSFYDQYDFAYSILCSFYICDKKSGTRWVRQEGSAHVYSTPELIVVERMKLDISPERVVERMKNHYRANTLLLGSWSVADAGRNKLEEQMKKNGMNLIFRRELDVLSENKPQAMHVRTNGMQKELSPV